MFQIDDCSTKYKMIINYIFLKYRMEALQIPIILTRIPDIQRRMSTTTQLFTRIDKNLTQRQLTTSKQQRIHPRSLIKQSLDNSKQNINYGNYLYKVKSAIKIDGQKITSNYLLSLRKQYDKMSKNIKMQSTNINVMKKDIQFIKNKLKNQIQLVDNSKSKIQTRKKQLCQIANHQQYEKMQTKSLEYIIQRMKVDQLKQKNNLRIKEQMLRQQKKQLKIKEDQVIQWDQTVHKMHQEMNKIKQQFEKHSQERQWKFKDYESHVNDLEEQQKFEIERKEKTFQLLNIQLNDILDAKNVVLRDVLLVNKALDKLLQCKISDLLSHYQQLQSSYHLIKTQTVPHLPIQNISDPQVLVKKFFSYSPFLQQMTSTISYYQQRQQHLIYRNKQLKQRQKQNLTKTLQQQKIPFSESNTIKQQKQTIIQIIFQKQVKINKIKSWIEKINLSLFGVQNVGDIQDNISKIHKYLLKSINQVQTHHMQISSSDSSQCKLQTQQVRLKKLIRELTIKQDKQKKIQFQQIHSNNNILDSIYTNHEKKKSKKNCFHIKINKNNNK